MALGPVPDKNNYNVPPPLGNEGNAMVRSSTRGLPLLFLALLMLSILNPFQQVASEGAGATRATGEDCIDRAVFTGSLSIVNSTGTYSKVQGESAPIYLSPIEVFQVEFTLRNVETVAEDYDIIIRWNMSGSSVHSNLNSTTSGPIAAGSEEDVSVDCRVPAMSDAGKYYIDVDIAPTIGTYDAVSDTIITWVRETPVVYLQPLNETAHGDLGLDGSYDISIKNDGNLNAVVDRLAIEPKDISIIEWDWHFTGTPLEVSMGSSVQATLTIIIPSNINPGIYGFVADARYYPEGMSTKKSKTQGTDIELVVDEYPFLSVGEVCVEPEYPMNGKPVTISASIENPSAVDARNTTVRFFILRNNVESQIGEDQSVNISAWSSGKASIETEFDIGKNLIKVIVYPNANRMSGGGEYTEEQLVLFTNQTSINVRTDPGMFILLGFVGLVVFLGIVSMFTLAQMAGTGGVSVSIPPPKPTQKPETDERAPPKPAPKPPAKARRSESPPPPRTKPPEDKPPLKAPAEPNTEPEDDLDMDRLRLSEKRGAIGQTPRPAPPPTMPISAPIVAPKQEEEEQAPSSSPDADVKKAEERFRAAQERGMDVSNIQGMLDEARESLRKRDYKKATNVAKIVIERVDGLTRKYDEAKEAIRETKVTLSSLKWEDVDLSLPRTFITRAESSFNEGDYVKALSYAKKAKNRALQLEKMNRAEP